MATFHIHQDAEKENPTNVLKERTVVGPGVGGVGMGMGVGKVNALQSSLVGGGGAMTNNAFKGKQTRSNFAVLHNGNTRNILGTVGAVMPASKVAFRNAKVHDDKLATFVSNNNNNNNFTTSTITTTTTTTSGIAGKKSTVVPVVEQFKTFSVYEDRCEQQPKHVAATFVDNVTTTSIVQDKENIYVQQQQQQQQLHLAIKNDSMHKDFGGDDDYILDTTPMSVSDVLSPMSVDRSQIMNSATKLIDDSNCEKIAEQQQQQQQETRQKLLPRNDRQRFFEVLEYQRDILAYFRESEQNHRPKPHYMRRQTDINYSMRTILVDWLVEVSEEYNLDTETLYLSVYYIDRFLSHMSVVRSKLQLVGTAAMYIASKYEEIYPPDVNEFVFITDDTYNKAQVLRMEQIILKILAFELCTPTIYVFVNTYAVLIDMPDQLKFLTLYICELSLLEADPYLRFLPSVISSASVALARHLLDYPMWTVELEDVTTYSLRDLKEVLLCLCKSHNAAGTLAQQAIQEKYKADKFKNVSSISSMQIDDEVFDDLCRSYDELSAASSSRTKMNENEQHVNAAATTSTAAATAAASNENLRRMISQMFN